jgi:type I restriction enzyme S subunit
MMLLRAHALFTPNLLMHWLNSPDLLARVRSLTGGSASPHLNVGEVKVFPVPIAPLAEQTAIVAEVERRLSIIDELEATVEANLTRADRLRQSVLSQAFSGRLRIQGLPESLDTASAFSMAAEGLARYGRDSRRR